MERFKTLTAYQKGLLIALCAILVIFGILYAVTTSRVGYRYRDTILVPDTQGDVTTYSGKISGKPAVFTVNPVTGQVVFSYGDKTYGPYIAREDSSAIPSEYADIGATGVELRTEERVLFRGCAWKSGDDLVCISEEGHSFGLIFSYTAGGIEYDSQGNVVDPMEPKVYAILELLSGPPLEHRGEWIGWLWGLIVARFLLLSMLRADDIFRWHLSFQISNPWDAEPTDWELLQRNLGWTAGTVAVLILCILGLQ